MFWKEGKEKVGAGATSSEERGTWMVDHELWMVEDRMKEIVNHDHEERKMMPVSLVEREKGSN